MNVLAIIFGTILLLWPAFILLQLLAVGALQLIFWLGDWVIYLGLALLMALGIPILLYGLGVWAP